jgi:integrase
MAKLVNATQHRGHHEGTYRLRPDGRWECRFTMPDGKRKSVYGRSRPDVRAKMEEALGKAKKGIDLKGEKQTVAHFLDTWLEETQRPRLRPSTLKSYESYIRLHIVPALGDKTLGELTAQDVQRFLNGLSKTKPRRPSKKVGTASTAGEKREPSSSRVTEPALSPRTVQYIRAILRAALGQALRWGYVERNVAALASPPRQQPKQVAALSAAHAQTLIDHTRDDRLGALFATALYTGMRQGELLGLRWPDVDLDAGTVRVRQAVQKVDKQWQFVEPKSANGKRTVPLCEPAVAVLKRQKEHVKAMRQHAGEAWTEWGLVFPSELGTPLDSSNVTKHLQRCLAMNALPRVSFHALRHTCGSLLHQEGVPARTIMEILGHSQITLTLGTYCHATDASIGEAAGALARALGGAP